jgi:predicted glycosyltransferase
MTSHRTPKIWVDLANSPHVPFFRVLIDEFKLRGHEVEVSARDFAQTVELAEKANLNAAIIGGHGGRTLKGKARNIIGRAFELRRWAREKKFDLAVSHNSYSQTIAARMLGIKAVTLMDYEHQPANHVAFRFANRVIVPRVFPDEALKKFGANEKKVRRYDGIKEDVYLADFARDEKFVDELKSLGVNQENILVVIRPPALDALYHRFENELFDGLLNRLAKREDVKVIFLPRTETQRETYSNRFSNFIIPTVALDGSNLIAHSDLVISAGGTMNREAAALGIPAATIYAGQWASLDEYLVNEGRLQRISSKETLEALKIEKKQNTNARRATNVKKQIVDLIEGCA